MTRVFCYGSLKRGFGNHRLLDTSTFVGEAITEARYTMIPLGFFPGVIQSGNTSIRGELYDVDEVTLRRLDRLEGHPTFYQRQEIDVLPVGVDESKWEQVSTYLLPESYLDGRVKSVEDGTWR